MFMLMFLVDTLTNERQTSYPKAGLILRTSSFKDSKGASTEEDTSKGKRYKLIFIHYSLFLL